MDYANKMNCSVHRLCMETITLLNVDETIQITSEEFFFPNMCHVCRRFGENAINLKRCGACQMISYCSREHQVKDWSNHQAFCHAVCALKKEFFLKTLFDSLKRAAAENSEDKLLYRKALDSIITNWITEIIIKLERKLTKTEYQMLVHPRVCTVCFESDPKLLANCKNCPLACFCKKHLNDPSHESDCKKSCFNGVRSVFYSNKTFSFDEYKMINSQYHPAEKKLPASMMEFIEMRSSTDLSQCGVNNKEVDDEIKSVVLKRFLSDRFSRGFTILFAIEKLSLNLKESLVIHIIGSHVKEVQTNDWEMILHYLPNLHKLHLIFIGPELFSDSSKTIENVCDVCKKEARKLFVEKKCVLYHEYARGENFLQPDLMACFNPAFVLHKTWNDSIKAFKKAECPLLVTALHTYEAEVDKKCVDSRFPSAKCIFNDFNPFTYIFFLRQSVYFPLGANNQCLYIYEYLKKKKRSK